MSNPFIHPEPLSWKLGTWGATFAHTLLLGGLAAEIVLIDVDAARDEGETRS